MPALQTRTDPSYNGGYAGKTELRNWWMGLKPLPDQSHYSMILTL